LEAGCSVHVIDNQHAKSSSLVGAGIINPVTGRRYVKSWRIEELIPLAIETYRKLEEELGIKFFHERNIIRSLFNGGEENDWLARTSDEAYQKYMLSEADVSSIEGKTAKIFSYGEVTGSYQTEMNKLVKSYREKLLSEERLTTEEFDFDKLELSENGVQYGALKADKIIFCDGVGGEENPYWSYLPWNGAKGEVIIARIPNADFTKIFKYRIFIVPLPEKDLYWIGSKYDWTFESGEPTEEGKNHLKDRLSDALTIPFEIVEHKAAVRPTVKDRRPFLGIHADFPQVGIFNGLGTKGASLGPFFAAQMVDFLIGKGAIESEADISRFNVK
jgi:glycine oxidase